MLQVADVFAIKWVDVEDKQQCTQFVQSLLKGSSLLTPAVGLLLQFPVSMCVHHVAVLCHFADCAPLAMLPTAHCAALFHT